MHFMKNIRNIVLTISLLAFLSVPAFTQTKTASVDMKKLFNGYWKTKSAHTLLEKSKTDLRKDLKDMADNLEKSQADYKQLLEQANDPAISAGERDKRKLAIADKAKEINNSKVAFEQYQRQAESNLAEKSQRMSGNLVADILNSAATEVVVYSDPGADLTDSVLKQLNEGAPIDVTKPAGGMPFNISTNLP